MPGKTPVIIMLQGDEPGARWKLQENRVTTVGRSSRNEISLVHPSISRFHCEISYINGLWYLADLNSRKGTVLNGVPVTDREVLKPGDIVRLSKNVLKFDMIDETAKDDEAMMAIRDAALDVKAGAGAGESALEDMRMRSQLGEEEARPRIDRKLLMDVGIIAGSAVVVAVVVAVVLGVLRQRVNAANGLREKWAQDAKTSLDAALADVNAGPVRWPGALVALVGVAKEYPGTEESKTAVTQVRQLEALWIEHVLGQIAGAEAAANYRDALAHSAVLKEGLMDPQLKRFVQERQEFTERLARTTFRRIKDEAELLLADDKKDEAVQLFEKAKETIGVPDLVNEAQFNIDLIQGKATGPDASVYAEPEPQPGAAGPQPQPKPEPPPVPEEDIEDKLKPPTRDDGRGPAVPPTGGESERKPKRDPDKKLPPPPEDDIENNFRPPTPLGSW